MFAYIINFVITLLAGAVINYNIIALVNNENKGDDASAIGTAKALKEISLKTGKSHSYKIIDSKDIKNLQEEIRNSSNLEKYIIIAAGSHHAQPLVELKQNTISPDKIYTILNSHQLFSGIYQTAEIIDAISLPKYALDTKKLSRTKLKNNTELIETIDIPHNTSKQEVVEEYQKFKAEFPTPHNNLLVMLGGDAPSTTGKIRIYTAKEAYNFGRYIAKIAMQNNKNIIATNGPRTGQYNPYSKVKLLTHRETHPTTGRKVTNYQLDKVSQAFIKGVKSINNNIKLIFFDFKFTEAGVDSKYKAMLGLFAADPKSNMFYFAGDSISSPIEAFSIAENGGNLVIYVTNSMNSIHHNFAKSFLEYKRANMLDKNFKFHSIKDVTPYSAQSFNEPIAAEKIANNIYMKFIKDYKAS